MRRIVVIGIGAGDPAHLTQQAIAALRASDVLFELRRTAADLTALRREICDEHGIGGRVVSIAEPQRDRGADDYAGAVQTWRDRRADAWEEAIGSALGDGGVGAFLVWGDPSLYDSTIAVLDEIAARGRVTFEVDVIPGVSSLHALTAAHRISLNRIGGAVQITTGRRLAEQGLPAGVGDVVVMLDGQCAFTTIDEAGVEIFWGAYLGTTGEILIAGPLAEVAPEIARVRAHARQLRGWIMDTYLLRRAAE
jgi:precorrin-6A synthase